MDPLAKFHHVALTVSDLERSAAFYTEVLGMVELFREDSPNRKAAVFRFASGGHSVGVVEHAGSSSDGFDPTYVGLDHFAFAVSSRSEMRAWAAHLDSHGVEHSGPVEIPPGEILNFRDPDGIAVALFLGQAAGRVTRLVRRQQPWTSGTPSYRLDPWGSTQRRFSLEPPIGSWVAGSSYRYGRVSRRT